MTGGSIWSQEEDLATFRSEETNICLKGGGEGGKKILISLPSHTKIKVCKTYPSKAGGITGKMEIRHKLTVSKLGNTKGVSNLLGMQSTGEETGICAYINIF